MKTRLLLLVSLVLGFAALARADSYSFKEPFSRTAAFSATGALALENVNGDVTVRTWDKNEILIEGEKSARTAEELAAIELTIQLQPDHAVARVHLPKRSGWFGNNIRAAVRFTITLPKTATIEKLQTVNASVAIDGLQGAVRAETVNGGLHVTGLGGDVHLETVNGSVIVDNLAPRSGHRVSAETVNGRIVISLPRDAGAALHASVVNGHIECDFPVTLGRGASRHSLDATIGSGGANISASTVNGGIQIKAI